MKNFLFSFMLVFLIALFSGCNTAAKAIIESDAGKHFAVATIEKLFDVRIENKSTFQLQKIVDYQKIVYIFGEKLSKKFTDTLAIHFENQDVRTKLTYIRQNRNEIKVTLDRRMKPRNNLNSIINN